MLSHCPQSWTPTAQSLSQTRRSNGQTESTAADVRAYARQIDGRTLDKQTQCGSLTVPSLQCWQKQCRNPLRTRKIARRGRSPRALSSPRSTQGRRATPPGWRRCTCRSTARPAAREAFSAVSGPTPAHVRASRGAGAGSQRCSWAWRNNAVSAPAWCRSALPTGLQRAPRARLAGALEVAQVGVRIGDRA